MTARRPGKIVTFYSYKGGTGRSMAVANVAWILASARKRVLVIDWDLEAPGLHRYFAPFLLDPDLASSEGLVDFVYEYSTAFMSLEPSEGEAPSPADKAWFEEQSALELNAVSIRHEFPEGGLLDLIPAGRQDDRYATLVNAFDWRTFYEKNGGYHVLQAVKDRLRSLYDYVLIDSRTGVSDTSGICTVHLPDTLVICFTLNNQGIEGASAVAASAQTARRGRHGVPRLEIFPVPMRVDNAESEKLKKRREYARGKFRGLLGARSLDDEEAYWNEVEVPYVPVFAYEEVLATFQDSSSDPKSLLGSLLRLSGRLFGVSRLEAVPGPAQRQQILRRFAQTPELEPSHPDLPMESALARRVREAEELLASFTEAELARAKDILLRLVHVTDIQGAEHAVRETPLVSGGPQDDAIVERLKAADIVEVKANGAAGGPQTIRLADDTLLHEWTRLRSWIEEDLAFLVWRQQIEWRASRSTGSPRLSNAGLATAQLWLRQRSEVISAEAKTYIAGAARKRRWRRGKWAVIAAGGVLCAGIAALFATSLLQSRVQPLLLAASQAAEDRPLEALLLLRELEDPLPPEATAILDRLSKSLLPSSILRFADVHVVAISSDGARLLAGSGTKAQIWQTSGRVTPVEFDAQGVIAYSQFVPGRHEISILTAPRGSAAGGGWLVDETGTARARFPDAAFLSVSGPGNELIVAGKTVESFAITAQGPLGKPRSLWPESVVRAYRVADRLLVRKQDAWPEVIGLGGKAPTRSLSLEHPEERSPDNHALFISNEGTTYLAAARNRAWAWRLDRGERVYTLEAPFEGELAAPSITSADLDSKQVVVGWSNGDVGIWDLSNLENLRPKYRVLARHAASVVDVTLGISDPSPPHTVATFAVSTSNDGTAKVIPLLGREDDVVTIKAGRPLVTGRLLPDGKSVVLVTKEGVELWPLLPPIAELRSWRHATTACLPPDRRRELLDESLAEAHEAFARCEAGFGREPSERLAQGQSPGRPE